MSDQTPEIPAGWYPDWTGEPQERFWNGAEWTVDVRPPTTAAPAPPVVSEPVAEPEPESEPEPEPASDPAPSWDPPAVASTPGTTSGVTVTSWDPPAADDPAPEPEPATSPTSDPDPTPDPGPTSDPDPEPSPLAESDFAWSPDQSAATADPVTTTPDPVPTTPTGGNDWAPPTVPAGPATTLPAPAATTPVAPSSGSGSGAGRWIAIATGALAFGLVTGIAGFALGRATAPEPDQVVDTGIDGVEVAGGLLTPGTEATERLTVGGVVEFELSIVAAQDVTIRASSNDVDTVLELRDDTGAQIAENDDFEECCDSRIDIFLDPGVYTVVVRDFASNDSGQITVRVD